MKNSFRKIMAMLMAIMMLAALGMSVSAETAGNANTVTFTKKLTKETYAYAPATDYTFSIAPGTAVDGNADQAAVYAGPANGALFVTDDGNKASLTITSTPATDDTTKAELSYTCQIAIDISKFTTPGIYRYNVTESGTAAYAGITYDTATRYLDVYIIDGTDGKEVSSAVLYKATATNVEDAKDDGFTNDYDTADLTVSKTVDGNLGDTNKAFSFNLEITGAAGEQFYIQKYTGTSATGAPWTITAGTDGKATSSNIELKHNESFKVYGLSAGDSYSVTETNYAADGYNTKVSVNSAEATTGLVGSGSIAAAAEGADVVDATVAFTNTKEATVPTGVAMDVLPFVAMIVVAGVLALLFFRKKERREA